MSCGEMVFVNWTIELVGCGLWLKLYESIDCLLVLILLLVSFMRKQN